MYNYPFFPFLKRRYNPYYYGYKEYNNISDNSENSSMQLQSFEKSGDILHNTDKINEPMFEVLGLQLYFDDILLICLLLFLFTEGVDDQYLFIALILLLLS